MKKILMNAAIATGFALFAGNAFAEGEVAFSPNIGFEDLTAGEALDISEDDAGGTGLSHWVLPEVDKVDHSSDSNVVTAYGEVSAPDDEGRPDDFVGEANYNFLKIDSPNGISRYMTSDGSALGLGKDVYVDMNVQFTVSDAVLELGENTDEDKLAIWLYAPDEGAETNLVITAATVDEDGKPTAQNFVATLENEIEPEKWYRLTVKASGSVGLKGPYFNVYIDGEKVSSSETVDGGTFATPVSDFYSLVQHDASTETTYTLSSVTFQGVGALDDLAFTTNKPGFIPAEVKPFAIGETGYDTFAEAVAVATVNDVIKVMADNTSDMASIAKAITVDLNGNTLTFSGANVNILSGVAFVNSALTTATVAGTTTTFVVDPGTLTIGASSDAGAITVTALIEAYTDVKVYGSNAKPTLSEDGDLQAWSTAADAEGYYSAVAGGGDEPGEGYDSGDGESTFTIDSVTEAALEDNLPGSATSLADKVSADSDLTYAQAYALGLWDENAEEVEDLEATIAIGADGKVTVSLANEPADGYVVTCKVYEKASLTATEWTLKDTYPYGSAKPITPASATAGFYKVEVTISNAD